MISMLIFLFFFFKLFNWQVFKESFNFINVVYFLFCLFKYLYCSFFCFLLNFFVMFYLGFNYFLWLRKFRLFFITLEKIWKFSDIFLSGNGVYVVAHFFLIVYYQIFPIFIFKSTFFFSDCNIRIEKRIV